ncbi:MAG: hypothetical protein O7G87_16290, partial [bacterium]|nr:hypothetical protein [bacterium]
MGLQNAPWQRLDQPALSSMTTHQTWCRVTLYNPTVLKVGGTYKMWYLGNRSQTRVSDMDLGYATSDDGLHWTEHPDNPILTGDDLPETYCWQTPHVILDENRYRMWFVMSTSQRNDRGVQISYAQQLGYAESPDGLSWKVHPEPLYPSGRRPCVLKDGPNAYRMWMNSSPEPDG